MPFDVYSIAQLCALLAAYFPMRKATNAHKIMWAALALWWMACMMSQTLASDNSPALVYLIITGAICALARLSGRVSETKWPYTIVALLIVSMCMDLVYFVFSQVDVPSWRGHYQNAGAAIFYLCIIWMLTHKYIRRLHAFSPKRT